MSAVSFQGIIALSFIFLLLKLLFALFIFKNNYTLVFDKIFNLTLFTLQNLTESIHLILSRFLPVNF